MTNSKLYSRASLKITLFANHMEGQSKVVNILKEYDAKKRLMEDFCKVSERLVSEILAPENLQVHSVTSRVKDRNNLKEKIERPDKEYNSLEQITDIVGIRIITQFEDDVDKVGTIIEREFLIDKLNSIDKRKLLDPDRFGYLSLHYICSLNTNRNKLVEYKRFNGLVCEIQIRSILQHAWAEIEHDLGYKGEPTIPGPIKRQFSRLAGLLELADMEFSRMRDELSRYSASVETDILENPSEVAIDDISLLAFIGSDPTVIELDREFAHLFEAKIDDRKNFKKLAAELQYANLTSISEVRNALVSRKRLLLEQARERSKTQKMNAVHTGISLFHLFQVMVTEAKGMNGLTEAFHKFGIGLDTNREQLAAQIVTIIKDLSQ